MTEDKRICAGCVKERWLSAEVARSEEDEEPCDYCQNITSTVSISEVADACDHMIETYFTLTSETPAVVYYERTPEGQSLLDMLNAWLNHEDQGASYDVAQVLEDRWANEEDGRYGEDPWFVRQGSSWAFDRDWRNMERSLRNEARLVNPKVAETLEKVFGNLAVDRTANGEAVIFEAGPNRTLQTLYRARVFEHRETLEKALKNPEQELGPPSASVASAGRMNSKGVSVFYGALDRTTALHEVRPPVGADVAIAAFTLIRPLRLLNLPALTTARIDQALSLFDPATEEVAQRCEFINTLEDELTKPVLPSLADGGYLVTQAIADYLATHRKLDLDGVFFRSVQSRGTPDEPNGYNVILFHKAATVKTVEVAETHATLGYQIGEDEWEGPCITSVPKRDRTDPFFNRAVPGGDREASLELQRDSIEIHRVQWVNVNAIVENVEHKIARHNTLAPAA